MKIKIIINNINQLNNDIVWKSINKLIDDVSFFETCCDIVAYM